MIRSQSLRFECIRCGACCIDQNTIVNTSYFDLLRIKDGLNLTLDELIYILGFYVFENKISESKRKKLVISPIIVEKGLAFVGLFKKKNGECYFYNREKQECSIYDLRPMFCRTFPFSFQMIDKDDNSLSSKIKITFSNKGIDYCPGISENSPIINIKEWVKVGKKTLDEIGENEKIISMYNSLVNEGKIQPTVKTFLNFLLNFSLSDLKI
ncbi:MAG: YkgJ family cysteine cluster protein [Candidatus Hodarchaeota archaeon]